MLYKTKKDSYGVRKEREIPVQLRPVSTCTQYEPLTNSCLVTFPILQLRPEVLMGQKYLYCTIRGLARRIDAVFSKRWCRTVFNWSYHCDSVQRISKMSPESTHFGQYSGNGLKFSSMQTGKDCISCTKTELKSKTTWWHISSTLASWGSRFQHQSQTDSTSVTDRFSGVVGGGRWRPKPGGLSHAL